MKKQLLILMTLCISLLGYSQTVGDTFIEDFITYEVTSVAPNEVQTTDYNTAGGTVVIIPDTVINTSISYSVTKIGPAAFQSKSLTSVTISNNVTEIRNYAFRNNNLTSIIIPENVTNIQSISFVGNPITNVISKIMAPSSSLASGVFDNLSTIDLTVPIGSIGFYNAYWPGFNSITEEIVLAVGDNFVVNFITYEVISIAPNEVKVHDYDHNNGSTDVVIPDTVTNGGTTYNVSSIGNDAFLQKGLTSVSIPDSVTYIGSSAFRNNLLTSISISDNVTTMQGRAFESNILETVIIGNGVPNIESLTFYDNQIDNLIIGSGVLSISSNAFNANSLTSLTIPDNVTSVAANAFLDNELTNITFGNGLTNIGISAFGVNQLESITIPDNVTQIAASAFLNNPLTSVISLGTTPPTINTAASGDSFSNDRSNINLILTGNTTNQYVTDSGAQWTGFKMVFEATSATTVKVSDYEAANGTTVSIPAAITVPSVSVFNVTEIGDSAFANKGLTSVTIPNSVTTILTDAFATNSLTSVTIPDSVINIGYTAFSFNSLSNIVIGANVDQIGIGAFVDNNLTDITIPSNVTYIGLLAFGNNPSLASVTSLATVPPTITTGTNDTFIFDRSNTALHIPAGTMAAYVTDPGALWTGFNPVTEDALSVSDFELANNIKVITTTDNIEVIASNNIRLENYTLYSISGSKIATGTESEISTTSFAKGIYILKLDFDKGAVTKKVLVN